LAPELAAGVEDVLDDEPELAADDVLELLLLLLPQPTITAALNSATSTAATRLQELLKSNSFSGDPSFGQGYATNAFLTGALTACQ
jgi:hypothetical protein